MEVLRRCPVTIAQRLEHCAIAVSTAVLGQSHKDNVRCTAVELPLQQVQRDIYRLSECLACECVIRSELRLK